MTSSKPARERKTVSAGNIASAARDREDTGAWLNLAYGRDEFEAVAVGHDYIRDHEIEIFVVKETLRLLAALDGLHVVAALRQPVREQRADAFLVFGDQD